MAVPSFATLANVTLMPAVQRPPAVHATTAEATPAGSPPSTGDEDGFTFHDLVSIVNPLQHFPVVSTLYRKFTGDMIKPFERVAGDTLYGGWMGLASSVANLVFEKETGKDFGDTVLALITGDDAKTAVAANTNAPTGAMVSTSSPPATRAAQPAVAVDGAVAVADVTALKASMANAKIDPDLGQRALDAYRRSLTATQAPQPLSPGF